MFVGLVALPSCARREAAFRCRDHRQCVRYGVAGACEREGSCSFPATDCPTGARYGELAPADRAGRCVPADQRVHELPCGAGAAAAFVWSGNGACYTRHDTALSWFAAARACVDRGGHLATFSTATEANAVAAPLGIAAPRDGGAATAATHWMGVSDSGPDGTLAWVTGEAFLAMYWRDQKIAAPLPLRPDCMAAFSIQHVGGTSTSWDIVPCTQRHPYLCEALPWIENPADGHMFRAVYARLSWDQARTHCAKLGAHLATVTAGPEQAFVSEKFPGASWLGGSDLAVPGRWAWITGEPFAFHAFAPGEPDRFAGEQHCLMLASDRLWHDRLCSNPAAALCERD